MTEFQYFWRCAHHPSALQNFQDERTECMWECHTQELRWWHNGFHPMPKSWGTPPPLHLHETLRYPCGCEASGTYPLPTYCPTHGAPSSDATQDREDRPLP